MYRATILYVTPSNPDVGAQTVTKVLANFEDQERAWHIIHGAACEIANTMLPEGWNWMPCAGMFGEHAYSRVDDRSVQVLMEFDPCVWKMGDDRI